MCKWKIGSQPGTWIVRERPRECELLVAPPVSHGRAARRAILAAASAAAFTWHRPMDFAWDSSGR